MEPKPIVELHTFRYPADDQLLICLLFQLDIIVVCTVSIGMKVSIKSCKEICLVGESRLPTQRNRRFSNIKNRSFFAF